MEVNREPAGKCVAVGRHSTRSSSRLPSMKRWSGVRPLPQRQPVSIGTEQGLWRCQLDPGVSCYAKHSRGAAKFMRGEKMLQCTEHSRA